MCGLLETGIPGEEEAGGGVGMDWFRWYHGTTIDPKWRVVSRKCGQPIHAVVAVWAAFLERASESSPRGSIAGWDAEDIGAALDIEADDVRCVHEAMQGKVLDGDEISGWGKRQPKRERPDDSSAERVREHRQRQKGEPQRPVTPRHATERLDEMREEEREKPTGSNEPDAERRVENSPDPQKPQSVAAHFLPLIRDKLYVPDGKPPLEYAEGRDVTICAQLVQRGVKPDDIEAGIEGLAILRDKGGLDWLPKGAKVTMRALYETKSGVRPVMKLAQEACWSQRARDGPRRNGLQRVAV